MIGYDSERRLGPRVLVRPEPEQELLPGVTKIESWRKIARVFQKQTFVD